MARRMFVYELAPNGRGWIIRRADTGAVVVECMLPADAGTLHEVALYGLKQAVADGGAESDGAPLSTRIEGMRERAAAITAAEWRLRERGVGTRTAPLPDAVVFYALVRMGKTVDNAENRERWRRTAPAVRAAIAARPEVAAAIAAGADTAADADDIADWIGDDA